jgi:hypothetical protein
LVPVILVVALAAPQAAAQSGSEWEFVVAPYLWAAGMDGTVRIGDLQQEAEIPFSDIIENLEFALMGHFEMQNERWALSSDLVFVDLEDQQDLDQGTVTVGVDLTLFELAGGYRVTPAVTLLLGARWADAGTSFHYGGEVLEADAEASKSWIDPLVGVHVVAPLSDRWMVDLRGDLGGFGVGSDLTWQAYANVGFKASDLITVVAGYRALDMDFEDDDGFQTIGLDLLISGPLLGVAFTF